MTISFQMKGDSVSASSQRALSDPLLPLGASTCERPHSVVQRSSVVTRAISGPPQCLKRVVRSGQSSNSKENTRAAVKTLGT